MVFSPEELSKKELEEKEKADALRNKRVSTICGLVDLEFEADVKDGKITSKGGTMKYPGNLDESEVCIVVDYLAQKGWKTVPEERTESTKIKACGKDLVKSVYHFNITPMGVESK